MFTLLILLITLIQNLASADEVKSYLKNPGGVQLYFPRYKKTDITDHKDHEIKSNSGSGSFKITCEVYANENPLIKVYTDDGILLDAVTLSRSIDNPCAEFSLNNYIVPKAPEDEQIVLVYLFAKENQECNQRFYTVKKFHMMATVTRSGYYNVPCSPSVKQFLQTFEEKAGGILDITKNGEHQVMDYNENVAKKKTYDLKFPVKDLKGKSFTIICEEDTLTTASELTTGALLHEDFDQIVLDKFEMGSCSYEYLNVNRRIFNGFDHFKTTFKTLQGDCYEREYEYKVEQHFSFYSQLEVRRKVALCFPCPSKFTGDIDKNAYQPWFVRLKRIIFFFWAPGPYSVEVNFTPIHE